jgi:hypothetical protein
VPPIPPSMTDQPASHGRARGGTVLIVVAGISALLAALAVAFVGRMRGDAEEMAITLRETQARLMLIAACQYVQESSRLGLPDDPATPGREEGFGWIDVRDGNIGPKAKEGPDDDSAFPIGSSRRCPMQVLNRPPSAIQLTQCYNPIERDPAHPDFGMPYRTNPDPRPVIDDVAAFKSGDRSPVRSSVGLSWFRLRRETPSRFLVTCGAGATAGFREWSEIVAAGAVEQFGDRGMFEDLRSQEFRMWFLIEWSGAARDSSYHDLENDLGYNLPDNYTLYPMNASHSHVGASRSQAHTRDDAGTILWMQRLRDEPAQW